MVRFTRLKFPMLQYHAVPSAVCELLKLLAPSPVLAAFALAGGTSLALRFGHRLSVDLDFFTECSFDPEALHAGLELPQAMVVSRTHGSLTLNQNGTKLDFLRHAYPLLQTPDLVDDVRLMSVPDVAAMKLNAIANRGSKKDFFDLCLLLERFSINEMLKWFEQKYTNADPFIVIRSLAWFDDAELEPDPVSLNGLTWVAAQTRVLAALRAIT